jgi:hypothetical protein
VIADLHAQTNSGLRIAHLEKKLDAVVHEKTVAESKQMEWQQRAEFAEARLQEVTTQDQSMRAEISELKEQVRTLNVLNHTQMRQRVKDLNNAAERKVNSANQVASLDRQKLEMEKLRTQHVEEEAKRKIRTLEEETKLKIKNLEEESQRQIAHLEETAKRMEVQFAKRIEAETLRNVRLQGKIDVLCDDPDVGRVHNCKFPVQYHQDDLRLNWWKGVPRMVTLIGMQSVNPAETTIRDDTSLPQLQSLLRMIVGRPLTAGSDMDDLDISDCFQQVTEEPTDLSLALACFAARVVQWCFNTPFHIDQPECTKMQEVWDSIATNGELTS